MEGFLVPGTVLMSSHVVFYVTVATSFLRPLPPTIHTRGAVPLVH